MPQTTTGSTIVGYFEDYADAQRAVTSLQSAGFTSAHLGVASRAGSSYASGETGSSNYTSGQTGSSAVNTAKDKTEGAWDKFKNFFTGDAVEPYSDEKQSGDLASHEVTSGYQGGVSDFHETLQGMSVPEDQSKYFGHRFGSSENGTIVTVSAPGREEEARSILMKAGADLGDNSSSYDYSKPTTTTTEGTQNIQLLGEVLRVQKERINTGEVRFRKEVITDMQTVQVPVTREELVIERHAVTGNTPVQGTIGQSDEIRIPLSEERASLDKSTIVREEVSVGKRAIEDVESLSGETRREELLVDDETKTTSGVGTTSTTTPNKY